ncbi:SMI1/KNR4 family protein [Erythrobacter sp. THAF29]|uniref:SMI1/KNR4 family protein n=1 Tax=Erythrobacter sp. THAF29 TaxID=2587851 RepID=UPI001269284D|nr:SMI1/KNR4 family protein [Erythrobacter sp. THAF29]QFT76608.1 SMI1 / KNR4 family protein [Erythrobacter sp. THAF29]
MDHFADLLQALAPDAPSSVGVAGIADWEERMNARLPQQLRDILLYKDGGTLSPAFLVASGHRTVHFGRLLGLTPHPHGSIKKVSEWVDEIEHSLASIPPSLFIFADDWDGNAITFDAFSGEIGFMDHETMGDTFTDPETYYPIASSFENFLSALRPGQ